MKLMNLSGLRGPALIALMLLGMTTSPAASAEPCEIERNEWGYWVGDCRLDDLLGKKIDAEIIFPPPIWIRMPDLYADDADFTVYGDEVEVLVRTGNSGTETSAAYDVTAIITITGNGRTPQTVSLTGRASPLATGNRQWTPVGRVRLPDRVFDWDLTTVIQTDSDDFMNGGEIRELNETNNEFNDGICRVYGENPDLTVQACR